MALQSVDLGRGTRRFQRFVTLGGAKPSGGEPPKPRGVLDPELLRSAIPHAFRKLDPRLLIRNPVMFVVEITAVLVTLTAIADAVGRAGGRRRRPQVRGPDRDLAVVHRPLRHLRRGRRGGTRSRPGGDPAQDALGDDRPPPPGGWLARGRRLVGAAQGRHHRGQEGETIAGDGDVIEGIGFVNEAAITGESAPVLKEPGTDIRSSVTGGTTLVSDRIVVLVTTDPGETFLDRMIALVEGAKRQRTPNEIALAILLAGLTIIFLMATVTLRPFGEYAGTTVEHRRAPGAARVPHPDDDRRPPVRDRDRRHGSRGPVQRPRHERARGRGVR